MMNRALLPIPFLIKVLVWWAPMACLSAYAQQDDAPNVSADFTAIYWGQDEPGKSKADWEAVDLYYKTGNEFFRLEPYFNQFSPPQHYRGPSSMLLYRRQQDEEGKWQYAPVLTVALPHSDVFALFLTASQGNAGYSATGIDLSDKLLPNGAIGLLNLCGDRLAADIRGDRKGLTPYQLAIFEPGITEDAGSLPVKIAVYEEGWKPAYATVARINPERPYLIVFYRAQNRKGAYRMRMFRDLYQYRQLAPANEQES